MSPWWGRDTSALFEKKRLVAVWTRARLEHHFRNLDQFLYRRDKEYGGKRWVLQIESRYAERDVLGMLSNVSRTCAMFLGECLTKTWRKVNRQVDAIARLFDSTLLPWHSFVCDIHTPRRKDARSRSINNMSSRPCSRRNWEAHPRFENNRRGKSYRKGKFRNIPRKKKVSVAKTRARLEHRSWDLNLYNDEKNGLLRASELQKQTRCAERKRTSRNGM